jgi:hypothetical protein
MMKQQNLVSYPVLNSYMPADLRIILLIGVSSCLTHAIDARNYFCIVVHAVLWDSVLRSLFNVS